MNTLKYWGYVFARTFINGLPVLGGLLVAAIIFYALFFADKAYPQDRSVFDVMRRPNFCAPVVAIKAMFEKAGHVPGFTAVLRDDNGKVILKIVVWVNRKDNTLLVTETLKDETVCVTSVGGEFAVTTSRNMDILDIEKKGIEG